MRCPRCKEEKSSEDFYRNSARGRSSWCAKCHREWRKENPQSIDKDYNRNYYFTKAYGLSSNQVDELKMQQQNKCRICSLETDLEVDHDHNSGKVRGLLCVRCNLALGLFRDSPEIIDSASLYLKENNQ